jgi:uncharacterized membrane protein YqhA
LLPEERIAFHEIIEISKIEFLNIANRMKERFKLHKMLAWFVFAHLYLLAVDLESQPQIKGHFE